MTLPIRVGGKILFSLFKQSAQTLGLFTVIQTVSCLPLLWKRI